jgi:hypothetical protein
MLNGKAKEEFEKWFFNYYNKDKISVAMVNHDVIFKSLQEIVQQSYIISWFDSVGIYIYIDIARFSQSEYGSTATIWYNVFRDFYEIDNFKTRNQATTKAIEKAVEIFNQLNK